MRFTHFNQRNKTPKNATATDEKTNTKGMGRHKVKSQATLSSSPSFSSVCLGQHLPEPEITTAQSQSKSRSQSQSLGIGSITTDDTVIFSPCPMTVYRLDLSMLSYNNTFVSSSSSSSSEVFCCHKSGIGALASDDGDGDSRISMNSYDIGNGYFLSTYDSFSFDDHQDCWWYFEYELNHEEPCLFHIICWNPNQYQ